MDALANEALKGELSWQAAERSLQLAEESAAQKELEQERREWLIYAERMRLSKPSDFTDEELWREVNWARFYWLQGHDVPWLAAWQQSLQEEARRRREMGFDEPAA